MTRFLISIFILFGHLAFGQSFDSIYKITFEYSKGHSSWNPGVYSHSENIILTKNKDGNFDLNGFFRVKYSLEQDCKTFEKDTTYLSSKKKATIKRHYIQNLIIQLNTEKKNWNSEFIKPLLKKSSKKEITKIAKLTDKELFFDKDFREEKMTIIRKIQNFYKLDSFLVQIKANTDNLMNAVDTWNYLKIEVINKNDTTIYNSQFRFPIGQPILCYDKKDFGHERDIYNLEVNTAAQSFLPPESEIYKVLDMNNLNERYIQYCLENYFY